MTHRTRMWVGAVTAGAALIVLATAVRFDPEVVDRYDDLARSLLRGDGLSFAPSLGGTVARGPVYPLWLAVELWLARGSFTGVRVLEVFTLLLAGAVTAVAARRALGPSGALVAFAVVVAHPMLVWYSLKLGSETVSALIFALAALAMVGLGERVEMRSAALYGLVAGIAALTKSVFLVLVPAFVLSLLLTRALRQAWRAAAVVVLVASAITAPWIYRNREVSGHTVLQSLAGWNFWYDFDFDRAWGSGQLDANGAEPRALLRFGDRYRGHPYELSAGDDVRQDAFLLSEAGTWAAGHPAGLGRKIAANLVQFWTLSSSVRATVGAGVLRVAQLAVVCAGLFVLWRRNRLIAVWCLLVAALLNVGTSPVFAVGRHSVVLEPVLALPAAAAILDAWRRRRGTPGATAKA